MKVVKEHFVADNAEIIRQKYRNLKRSPRVERLMQLREDASKHIDLNDDRTKHVLGIGK